MFATDGTESDPVAVYKLFLPGRDLNGNKSKTMPSGRNQHFKLKPGRLAHRKGWFKSGAVAVNKLNRSMKTMV